MKFVVTGAAGHVSKLLTEILLQQGHQVTVIGRKAENLADLVKLGATAAIGDMQNVAFLTETLKGADGAYLMLPPSWDSDNIKQTSVDIAVGFVEAAFAVHVRLVDVHPRKVDRIRHTEPVLDDVCDHLHDRATQAH